MVDIKYITPASKACDEESGSPKSDVIKEAVPAYSPIFIEWNKNRFALCVLVLKGGAMKLIKLIMYGKNNIVIASKLETCMILV